MTRAFLLATALAALLLVGCGGAEDERCPAGASSETREYRDDPVKLTSGTWYVHGGYNYAIQWKQPIVNFRPPPGYTLKLSSLADGSVSNDSNTKYTYVFTVIDERWKTSWVEISAITGEEQGREFADGHEECGFIFDQLNDSVTVITAEDREPIRITDDTQFPLEGGAPYVWDLGEYGVLYFFVPTLFRVHHLHIIELPAEDLERAIVFTVDGGSLTLDGDTLEVVRRRSAWAEKLDELVDSIEKR